jgi:hypothetical protein
MAASRTPVATGAGRRWPTLRFGQRAIGIAGLVLGLLTTTVVGGCTDPSGASGPDAVGVGFGTGGSDCELTEVSSTFQEGTEIRVVVTFEPALMIGSTIEVDLERDGVAIPARHQTIDAQERMPCLYGVLDQLDAGHYTVTSTVSPSQMPPVVGEFDVVR